jgi:hypothetical protein
MPGSKRRASRGLRTVVTETHGWFTGQRVVRGHEAECLLPCPGRGHRQGRSGGSREIRCDARRHIRFAAMMQDLSTRRIAQRNRCGPVRPLRHKGHPKSQAHDSGAMPPLPERPQALVQPALLSGVVPLLGNHLYTGWHQSCRSVGWLEPNDVWRTRPRQGGTSDEASGHLVRPQAPE